MLHLIAALVLATSQEPLPEPPPPWVAAGFAAQIAATSHFAGGHAAPWIRANDFAPDMDWEKKALPQVELTFDEEERTATVTLGPVTRTAVYRDALGSALVHQRSADELRAEGRLVPPPPARDAAEIPWPDGDRLPDLPPPEGVDAPALEAALAAAFVERPFGPPARTYAVVVVLEGRLIAERYAEGFGPSTPILGASMTKSLLDALVGIRSGQGELDVDAPTGLDAWSSEGDPRAELTLENLLRMESGLDCDEEGLDPDRSLARMLFGSPSASDYAAAHKEPLHEPGTTWRYCSGTSNLIGRVLRESFDDRAEYLRFPRDELFLRIGMRSAFIETDPSGTFVTSSLGYAGARDWARFGMLYLDDGVWNGERILPEGWVAESLSPTASAGKGHYGRHWWLNAGTSGDPERRFFPLLPTDLFFALGYGGQIVAVFPSEELIVVRLGLAKVSSAWNHQELLTSVLAAVDAD